MERYKFMIQWYEYFFRKVDKLKVISTGYSDLLDSDNILAKYFAR